MEVLQGAYGLAEALCLWYLRAGNRELSVCRAELGLASSDGELAGLCGLHVDDALLYDDPKRKTFKSALAQVNSPAVNVK